VEFKTPLKMILSTLLDKVQDTPPCIFSRLALRQHKTRRTPEDTVAPFLDIIRFTMNSSSLHHALLVVCSSSLIYEPTQSALVHALINPFISIPDIIYIMDALSKIKLGKEYENLAENVMCILEVCSMKDIGLFMYLIDMMESQFHDKPLFVHRISHQSLLGMMGKHQQGDTILAGVISVLSKYRVKAYATKHQDLIVICETIKNLRRKGTENSRHVLKQLLEYLLWLVKGNSHGIT
jgi:hypothetical protein